MPNTDDAYQRGDEAVLDVDITDIDGAPADPSSLTLTIVTPAGVPATYTFGVDAEIVRLDTGAFRATIPLPLAGIWLYQWQSTTPGQVGGGSLFVGPAPVDAGFVAAPAWLPTVGQVAALVRARTRGAASRDAVTAGEQGTFTEATRPTRAPVLELIDLAGGELTSIMDGRDPCTAALRSAAGSAAAYRAAMLVEVGYFPEQTNTDQTAFKALAAMWKDAAASVAKAVMTQCPLTPGGTDVAGGPIGRVPCRRPTTWSEAY